MKIRFGVGLGVGQSLDTPAQLGDVVDLLEALGFDSLWRSDRVTGGALDPIAALAFAAGRTTKLKLGDERARTPLAAAPFLMARQLVVVDQLSGGRLLPAVGLGSPSKADRPPFGVPKGTRAQRFEDGLAIIRGSGVTAGRRPTPTSAGKPMTIDPRPPNPSRSGSAAAAFRRCSGPGAAATGGLGVSSRPNSAARPGG